MSRCHLLRIVASKDPNQNQTSCSHVSYKLSFFVPAAALSWLKWGRAVRQAWGLAGWWDVVGLLKKKISLAGLMAVAQPANAWPQGLVACHVFRCFLGLFWALQTFSGCFRCFGPFMGISRRFWCFLVFPGCFGPFLGGVFLAVFMFSGLSWVFRNLWAAFSGRFWCFLAFSGGFGLFVGISGVFGVFWPFLGVSGCLWALLGVFGVFWPFLGVSGCLWAFLGVFGVFWSFLGVSGCFWAFLGVFFGFFWSFLGVSGCFWAFLGVFGVFWSVLGVSRLFLGISGRVWCFLVCPGCFKAFWSKFYRFYRGIFGQNFWSKLLVETFGQNVFWGPNP